MVKEIVIQAPSFSSSVILGKQLNLCEPQFTHMQEGYKNDILFILKFLK